MYFFTAFLSLTLTFNVQQLCNSSLSTNSVQDELQWRMIYHCQKDYECSIKQCKEILSLMSSTDTGTCFPCVDIIQENRRGRKGRQKTTNKHVRVGGRMAFPDVGYPAPLTTNQIICCHNFMQHYWLSFTLHLNITQFFATLTRMFWSVWGSMTVRQSVMPEVCMALIDTWQMTSLWKNSFTEA